MKINYLNCLRSCLSEIEIAQISHLNLVLRLAFIFITLVNVTYLYIIPETQRHSSIYDWKRKWRHYISPEVKVYMYIEQHEPENQNILHFVLTYQMLSISKFRKVVFLCFCHGLPLPFHIFILFSRSINKWKKHEFISSRQIYLKIIRDSSLGNNLHFIAKCNNWLFKHIREQVEHMLASWTWPKHLTLDWRTH